MKPAVFGVVVVALGCAVPDLDLEGRPCPCIDGWVCEDSSNTCVRAGGEEDSGQSIPDSGRPIDTGSAMDAGRVDAGQVDSGSKEPDSGTNCHFFDFEDGSLSGWTVGSGTWSASGGEAIQSDSDATLAAMWADVTDGSTDFVARSSMRQVSGAMGGALEITFRLQTDSPINRYFCNWEPNSGLFLLMRSNASGTVVLMDRQVDLATIPGYDPFGSFTMVLEVEGSMFNCRLEEIPQAAATASDPSFSSGAVGLKTYRISGAYDWLEVCPSS